jgi:hypothetical protein
MNINNCIKCGNPVGNDVFTVCDDCWDLEVANKIHIKAIVDPDLNDHIHQFIGEDKKIIKVTVEYQD